MLARDEARVHRGARELLQAWAIGTELRYYTVTTAQGPATIIVEVYH